MVNQLKAGVIGAGVFGGYHAKQYANRDGASLVGIFDLDAERARAVADPLGAATFEILDDLIAACDVISV